MNTPQKEKSLSEMNAGEIHAGLKEWVASQPGTATTEVLPPGIAADAKPKDVDAACLAILNKSTALTAQEIEYLRLESLRVLKEGW